MPDLVIIACALFVGLVPLFMLVRLEGHARRATAALDVLIKIEAARAKREGTQVTDSSDPLRDRLGC